MKSTTIESVSSRAAQFPRKRSSLRWFHRLVFATVAMGCAVAGIAQVPSVPGPAKDTEEEKLAVGAPSPPQCPSQEILAGTGVNDNFSTANGPEIAAPSATLQAMVGGPFTDFDGTAQDRHFAHTFRLPPCKCLVGAKLEFRGKSLGGLSSNDSITLGFSTLAGFPRWTAHLTSLGGPVYSLDLAALPPLTPGPTISLLSAMQTHRYLDFYVQDDTSIDYVKLTVTMCDCCQKEGEGKTEICISKFYDKNRNGVKDSTEPGLQGWTFHAKDQAGGNVFTSPPTNATGSSCFAVLAPATYVISEVPQAGWVQTVPVNPANPIVTVTPGGPVVNLLFGNWRKPGTEPVESGNPKNPD